MIFFSALSGYALVSRTNFNFMGGFLFVGSLVILAAIVANIFLQMPVLSLMISGAAVLLISGAILWETSQLIHDPEANYIVIATSLLGEHLGAVHAPDAPVRFLQRRGTEKADSRLTVSG